MNSKQKGARGERELSNELKKYGFDTRRGQQYCGANGDADVVGLPGIYIECKRVEKLNIDEALEQAYEDSFQDNEFVPGEIPAVFHRRNKKMWKVTMYLEDWVKLYQAFIAPNLPTERENLTRQYKHYTETNVRLKWRIKENRRG